jgi:predicted dehydrogenase
MNVPTTDVPPLRWGIIGTGLIASEFARDLALLPGAGIAAVGSRHPYTAAAFADTFEIPHRHRSYRDLVNDDSVQAVYVATPHPGHYAAALLAIDAGKSVLVEKPFTVNAAQARGLIDAAELRGVFLMEAMWTRFLPHVVAVRDVLASGRLGEICTVSADHGQWFAEDSSFRLFAPELGGGALLDLGVYPVSFASMVLGEPDRIASIGDRAFTGVDAQISVVLGHSTGAHAVLNASLRAHSQLRASIVGTDGRLEIDPVWYRPSGFTVVDREGSSEQFRFSHEGHGIRHQAAEVARCVAAGLMSSEIMPLSETLSIMQTMDAIRLQGGFELPADRDSGSEFSAAEASG